MAWTAPRTWVAGEVVTAALLNAHVRDNLLAIGDPGAWTAYTPTQTGITAIGNGTITGRYKPVGKIQYFVASIAVGSTTTFSGTGWSIGLPTAGGTSAPFASVGGLAYDASANTMFAVLGNLASGATSVNLWAHGGTGVTNVAPFTWTTSDTLIVTGFYEMP